MRIWRVLHIPLHVYIISKSAKSAYRILRLTFLKFIRNVSRLALSRSACSRNIAAFLRTNVSYQSSLNSCSFFTRSAGRIKIAFQRVICCCERKIRISNKKKNKNEFQERNMISCLFLRFNKRINFRSKNFVILIKKKY